MTTLREAAIKALDAMTSFESGTNGLYQGEFAEEIAALKAALADGDKVASGETVQEPQLKRIHPLDMPLEVFVADLSTRPRNIINAEMMYFTHSGDEFIKPPFTVRHLMMFSRKELRKWPNLGKRSLNEIEEMLRSRGLQLWEEHDERSLRLLREHPTYYTAPPQRKPLTIEQILDLFDSHNVYGTKWVEFARAVEKAHGIK